MKQGDLNYRQNDTDYEKKSLFYMTNIRDKDLNTIREEYLPQRDENGKITPYYRHRDPIRLELYTYTPQDPLRYLISAFIGVDHMLYFVTPRESLVGLLPEMHLHHHDYYELLFVLSGSVYQNIEYKRHLYTAGSCCLLNRNVLHAEEHGTECSLAFLQISEELIRDLLKVHAPGFMGLNAERPLSDVETFFMADFSETGQTAKSYIDFIPVRSPSEAAVKLRTCLDTIAMTLISPDALAQVTILQSIIQILLILSDKSAYATVPVQIGSSRENQLFDKITRLMFMTNGRASRRSLENELHYSGDYLNKITQKFTGLSIFEYGMTICMREASRMLINTDDPVTEIAATLGFSNRTHFNRQFEKVFHCTPSAYRHRNKGITGTVP